MCVRYTIKELIHHFRNQFVSISVIAIVLFNSVSWSNDTVTEGKQRGFDVNDTTFILPLGKTEDKPLYPTISLSDNGSDSKAIMSLDLFDNIVTQFMKQTDGSYGVPFEAPNMSKLEYPLMKVTAIRYDPCFPGPTKDISQCIQQIRLVVTPVDNNANPQIPGIARTATMFQFPDYSMHLLYVIGWGLPSKNDIVLQQLYDIKNTAESIGRSSAGKALGVHPGLQSEVNHMKVDQAEGVLALKLKRFVLDNINQQKLAEVTVTNGNDSDSFEGLWNFMGGKIVSEKWIAQPIPRLVKDQLVQRTSMFGFIQDDSLYGPRLFSKSSDVPKADQISDTHALLNPEITNPKNTDCASCHLASEKAIQLSQEGLLMNPWSTYQTPIGITGFVDPQFRLSSLNSENLRVLGRLNNEIVVTSLAANSAALVAQTVNDILNLDSPTDLDCRAPEVRQCFDGVSDKGGSISADTDQCLSICLKQTSK